MILAPGTYDGILSVTTEKAVYTQPFQCEMKRNACYDASINLSTAARESIDGWNGEGTAEAPYQVATAEDLQRLIALCNSDGGEYAEFADKHYLQIADIDMAQIAIQPIRTQRTIAVPGRLRRRRPHDRQFHADKLRIRRLRAVRLSGRSDREGHPSEECEYRLPDSMQAVWPAWRNKA